MGKDEVFNPSFHNTESSSEFKIQVGRRLFCIIIPCSALVLLCHTKMVLSLIVQGCFSVAMLVLSLYHYISVSPIHIHTHTHTPTPPPTHTVFLSCSSQYHPINCFTCYILPNEGGQQGQYAGKLFCSEWKVRHCCRVTRSVM